MCTNIMHGQNGMMADPRFPTMPGRSTSGFHRPGRHCLHQAQTAVGCTASREKGELHPTKNRLSGGDTRGGGGDKSSRENKNGDESDTRYTCIRGSVRSPSTTAHSCLWGSCVLGVKGWDCISRCREKGSVFFFTSGGLPTSGKKTRKRVRAVKPIEVGMRT